MFERFYTSHDDVSEPFDRRLRRAGVYESVLVSQQDLFSCFHKRLINCFLESSVNLL